MHPHPPIVRWLLLPVILAAAGMAGGILADLLLLGRPELLMLGAGFGLGAAAALALTRRTWLRVLISPATTFVAHALAFGVGYALQYLEPPDFPRWFANLSHFPTPLLTLAPALALVLCLSLYEARAERRSAFVQALLATPFAAWLAATLASLAGGWGAHQIFAAGAALIGAALPPGFAAVLRLSRRLRPQT